MTVLLLFTWNAVTGVTVPQRCIRDICIVQFVASAPTSASPASVPTVASPATENAGMQCFNTN